MNTTAEKLIAARKLIEQGWTQGTYARDANGEDVDATDDRAVCWCSYGAIVRAYDEDFEAAEAARDVLRAAVGTKYAASWNDAPERTQAEVLQAFDDAIEIAGGVA